MSSQSATPYQADFRASPDPPLNEDELLQGSHVVGTRERALH